MLKIQKGLYWLFILPAIVITAACLALPLGRGVQISLTNLDFIKNTKSFVGLANYAKALSDVDFYMALVRNIIYVVVVVAFNFVIGLGMALVCNQRFAGNKVFRAVIVFPMLLIPTAAAVLWRFLYNYDLGLINKLLGLFRLRSVNWLGDTRFALMSIVITDIWAWTPWMFLILLAGLEGLPQEPLEAARIDGATGWSLLRLVILPMLRPITRVAVSLKAIETFRTFDYVFVMTRGGPGSSSDILSTFIYKTAFKNLQYGYSTALSLIVLVVLAGLSFAVLRGLILKPEH
jgi:multiple sugar transport system permease protein